MAPDDVVIRIDDLHYAYPDGSPALTGVTLAVRAGERVGIVGANGAGKSTLLLHLNGILYDSGRVRILGLPVEKQHLKEVRRRIGVVFQNPDDQLFCPTVFEDVAFGPRHMRLPEGEVAERVRRSLAAVGMQGAEKRSAFHMSYGEKKRVSIATVLAMGPEILALDEPTSNLDPRGRRELTELLERLGGTQVIVTHDLGLVERLCGRVVVMAKGRNVADGAPAAILKDQALLAEHGLA